MKTFKILMIIGVISLGLFSFTKFAQEEWVVPAKYEKMTNPTDATDADNLADGKMLYNNSCRSYSLIPILDECSCCYWLREQKS